MMGPSSRVSTGGGMRDGGGRASDAEHTPRIVTIGVVHPHLSYCAANHHVYSQNAHHHCTQRAGKPSHRTSTGTYRVGKVVIIRAPSGAVDNAMFYGLHVQTHLVLEVRLHGKSKALH